jgi:hypothetical protein
VEDGVRIAPALDATLRQDDADEVHGRALQQRQRFSVGQVPDVGGGDVAHDIQSVVDDGDRGESLVVHERQGVREWRIGTGIGASA